MDSFLATKFFNRLKDLDEKEYLLAVIRFHAAASLEGIKPSSLISFSKTDRNIFSFWMAYKEEVCELLKISCFELDSSIDRELVLFYNPPLLEKTINSPDNMKFLFEMGYGHIADIMDALCKLKCRFAWTFPHEIGLFLGIPLEDVEGFIKNRGMNFITNGYWKVYSNPESAVKAFQEYDSARIRIIKNIIGISC